MNKEVRNALNAINEKLKTQRVDNNNLIKGHRIDQRKDLKELGTKIVFNEKTTKRLCELMRKVLDTDLIEYGCYFFGKVGNGFVYIDDYGSEFSHSNGLYANAAVEVTTKNLEELDQKTEKEFTDKPYEIVIHFHTHPDYVKDNAGNIIKTASLIMSEQDLYNYGFHQLYLQPRSNNKVIFIGCMLAKNYNNPQISSVTYDESKQEFYSIKPIYIIKNNKLIKVNNNNLLGDDLELDLESDIKKRILKMKDEKQD